MLKIVGRTTDNRLVVSGVFRFYETTGLPLDVILDGLRERNMIPAWELYVEEAMNAGMAKERILSALDAAIVDTYGPELRDIVIAKLRI